MCAMANQDPRDIDIISSDGDRPLIKSSPTFIRRARRYGGAALGVLAVLAPTWLSRPATPGTASEALPRHNVTRVGPGPVTLPRIGVNGLVFPPAQSRPAPEAVVPFTDTPAFAAGEKKWIRNRDSVKIDITTGIPIDYLNEYVAAAKHLKHGATWAMLAGYAFVETENGLFPEIWNKGYIATQQGPDAPLGPMQLRPENIRGTGVNPFNIKQAVGYVARWMNAAGDRIVASGRVVTARALFEEMGIYPPAAQLMAHKAEQYDHELPNPERVHVVTIGQERAVSQEVFDATPHLF